MFTNFSLSYIVLSPMEMLNTGTELIESAHKVLLTSQRKIQKTSINRADLRNLRQTLNEGKNITITKICVLKTFARNTSFIVHQVKNSYSKKYQRCVRKKDLEYPKIDVWKVFWYFYFKLFWKLMSIIQIITIYLRFKILVGWFLYWFQNNLLYLKYLQQYFHLMSAQQLSLKTSTIIQLWKDL